MDKLTQKVLAIIFPDGVPLERVKEASMILEQMEALFEEYLSATREAGDGHSARPAAAAAKPFATTIVAPQSRIFEPSDSVRCSVPGCKEPKKAKNLCSKHYQAERLQRLRSESKK